MPVVPVEPSRGARAATSTPTRGASFRLKLTLLAILIGVIPLVAVGLVVEDVNEDALGRANQDLLDVVVGNVSGVADGVVDQADGELRAVASRLADPTRGADERIDAAAAAVTFARTVSEVAIYDAAGARVDSFRVADAEPSPPLPPRLDDALRARGADAPAFGEVSVMEDQAFILRTVPVQGQGARWTLAAQVTLGKVAERVIQLGLANLPRGHALLVVDTGLRIVADSQGERVGQTVTTRDAGILGGVDGAALDKGLMLTGEFRRADGETMLGAIRTIDRTPLAVVVEVPRRVAYHSIAAVRKIVAVAVGVAIVLAIIVAVLMARRVTRPIKALVDFAGDLANRRFERRVTIMARDELGVLGQALEGAATELAQSEENMRRELAIRADLGRYLPEQLVDQIVERKRDVSLGGERREITVMFADVVGFTPLAERQRAQDVVTMLNELFTILTEIVFRHGGTVDKFVGDCVMAMWGAPQPQADHAARAVAAAEDMQAWLEAGNESWRERFGFEIELAIGINSGEAVVGNFGSEKRMDYTAIGDTVNVAARLESIARPGQILVTAATRNAVGDRATFVALGARGVIGRSQQLELFEVRS